jgi:hypothetical protein
MTISRIFSSGIVVLVLNVYLAAEEPDILDLVKANPLKITTSAGTPKYGDPDLDAAVDVLADIPHPWTVSKIIDCFENSPWMQHFPLVAARSGLTDRQEDEKRQVHLTTLLAASRDPRAAPLLIKAMDYRSTVIKARARFDLYFYFLPDARYHKLPPEPYEAGAHLYTDFIPEMDRQVRAWWALNKDDLTAVTSKVP